MRCIFCKVDSSTSKSREHIIPESLGSKRRILQPGFVCDKCNNYFSRKVEEPLLSHPSMRNIRAWYQVPNKRGRKPSLLGYLAGTDITINLTLTSEGNINIQPENASDLQRFKSCLEPVAGNVLSNPPIFQIDLDPPKQQMSRFLSKMALEAVAERLARSTDANAQIVDSDYFDNIRTYAREGTNYLDWPYYQRRIYPEETLMRHPVTRDWVHAGFGCDVFMNRHRETLFVFCLYGMEFVINVGGPSIKGYEEWLNEHDNISPLVERLGGRLQEEGEGNQRKYYLHGEFTAGAGIDFDRRHYFSPKRE